MLVTGNRAYSEAQMRDTLQFTAMANKSELSPLLPLRRQGVQVLSALETGGLGSRASIGLFSKPQACKLASEAMRSPPLHPPPPTLASIRIAPSTHGPVTTIPSGSLGNFW